MGKKITFKLLFELIEKTAQAFVALGVKQGDIIPLALPNIPANIFCMYALNRIGAVGDFIDLRSKGQKLIQLINDTSAPIAVISDVFVENAEEIQNEVLVKKWIIASPFDYVPGVGNLLKLKGERKKKPHNYLCWNNFLKIGKGTLVSGGNSDVDSPACIFHTSGTTGTTKGVLMTNGNMNAMTIHYKHGNIACDRGDTFLNQIPPFLAYNEIFSVHMPFALQMSIILRPDYNPDKFLELIHKFSPSHVTSGPADLRSFYNDKLLGKVDFSGLKTIACGSDKLDYEKKLNLNALIKSRNGKYGVMEGYGMTEAGSAIVTCWPNADRKGSVGIPHFMNVVSIFSTEQHDVELKVGETGEICVCGPTVMKGYYNRQEETLLVLRRHSNGKVWLHTGDLGHMDSDGFVYIDGRIKRMIIRNDGIKVSPFEIEQTIKRIRGVLDVCVVGTRDIQYDSGFLPVAFVVIDDEAQRNLVLNDIKALCESELAENYRPSEYKIVQELPLTPNGKVDYRKLEEIALD